MMAMLRSHTTDARYVDDAHFHGTRTLHRTGLALASQLAGSSGPASHPDGIVSTMTDTDKTAIDADAGTPPVPSPIFSPDDPIDKLWIQAYQGEVLGEALFTRIANQLDDSGRADKIRTLSKLERRTKEAIAPALTRAGLSVEPDPEMLTLADTLAQGVTWEDFLAATGPITAQFIPLYQRIGELDPSEQESSDLLVAHEAALRAFAVAELAGDTTTSLDHINALAHMR